MRKAAMIVGAVAAVMGIAIAAILVYAARNLNSIIAERQAFILQKVSDSLGRTVEVGSIKASLGWGLVAQVTGLKIQDNPALSDRPFVEASDAYARVDLLPLLTRQIHVTEVTLKNPQVHIIRTEQGELNVSTIGKGKPASGQEEKTLEKQPPGASEQAPLTAERGETAARKKGNDNLAAIFVKRLQIEDGIITYEERGTNHQTLTISQVDLSVAGFSVARTFDFSLKLAALSDKQNVDISGTAGPLASDGVIDPNHAHFNVEARIGPLDVARLRAIGSIGKSIPEALSVPDPVSLRATAEGNATAVKFHVESDLTGNRIAWAKLFDKPAAVPFKLIAEGSRTGADLEIAQANVKLGDLEAKASNIKLEGGRVGARIDTNRFDLGAMAKMLPPMQKYDTSGRVEAHVNLAIADQQARAQGAITLSEIALAQPGAKKSLVKNLNGDIKLDGNSANVGPLKFDIGDGHATIALNLSSLQPAKGSYEFSVDQIKPSDVIPGRPESEFIRAASVSGTITQAAPFPTPPDFIAKLSVAEGNIAKASFKDLNAAAVLEGKRLNIQSFKVAIFNGNVAGSGTAMLEQPPEFSLTLNANNVDIQQALAVQDPKSAAMFRGNVDAQFQVSGSGTNFDEIKPTLKGSGNAAVRDGKLVGVNLVVIALAKTKGIPEIGDLIPSGVMKRHPELFNNPDTDITRASLTFTLQGIRISTRDLLVQAVDYGMKAAGWFDMDLNVDLNGHALLTRKFSQEIIDEKKNVVYLTNEDGEVDIPLRIQGKLPKPNVSPDLATMAQYATSHLVRQTGKDVVDKLFGKKKNGKNNNPLDQLKGLFK